jgi:L-iditol 2-dehydrogenase
MRVAMYYNNKDIRLEEMPIPEIGSGELLVKVLASGICGSDVMEWYRIRKAPRVLGHEITGEIVAVGKDIKNYKVGNRVFVSHHVPCNTCRYCLNGYHTVCETLHNTNFDPGGFAEYIRVPQINVDRGIFLLPDEISFEEGVFIEPLACVIRAQRLSNIQIGHSVLIIGSGISGLLHIVVARAFGASRIIATDINEYRMNKAEEFGADAVIYAKEDVPSRLMEFNENRHADVVIICTGAASAFDQAFKSVDRGGTVLFFAPTEPGINISIPINDFWRNGIKLIPSYGGSPLDIIMAIEMIRTHNISLKRMITHRLGLEETGLGFKIVSEAKESIKVIIEPHR